MTFEFVIVSLRIVGRILWWDSADQDFCIVNLWIGGKPKPKAKIETYAVGFAPAITPE